MKARTLRHCCVKGCPNQPAKGRKTCGGHGKRNPNQSIRLKSIHVDRVLKTFEQDAPIDSTPIVVAPLPEETPYIAGVAIRDNGSIIGLPTTRHGFKSFLADWLARPGRSLADIQLLVPPTIQGRDIGVTICDTAARMVKYDLTAPRNTVRFDLADLGVQA